MLILESLVNIFSFLQFSSLAEHPVQRLQSTLKLGSVARGSITVGSTALIWSTEHVKSELKKPYPIHGRRH
ncbi:hypothetical protein BGZ63DRAFT_387678 [Mariannaea sp. PMI_226]|nr:hypothetical protein BGZ63DRAFT_387678 [Mariannaea sp. PMI_226]